MIKKLLCEILGHKYEKVFREAVSFMIQTTEGSLSFRLPMDCAAVMQVINNQTENFVKRKRGRERVVPIKWRNDLEQAKRVGWRITKDWLEAQLALLELKMVKVQQLFLPYMINVEGKTLYEVLEQKQFQTFLIEDDAMVNQKTIEYEKVE